MEDKKAELDLLKETIQLIKKAQKNMASCDSVSYTEYQNNGLFIQELEDRAMKLEIDIHGCILEEV